MIITLDVDDALFHKLNQIQQLNFSVVEINQVDANILQDALNHFPRLRIGVGNILNADQLEKARQVGAHFASSLGFTPNLIQTAQVYDFHYLPGVSTFSEAMQAVSLGAQYLKPFPADPIFCQNLSKYLPMARLFPAQALPQEISLLFDLPAVAAVSLLNPDLEILQTIESLTIS